MQVRAKADGAYQTVAGKAACDMAISALEKLNEYEELNRKGLLLKLPCKIGDVVWDIGFGMPYRFTVTGFDIGRTADDDEDEEEKNHEELYIYYQNRNGLIRGNCPVSEIGKTVFFTREEALKKLQSDDGSSGDTE